MDINVYDDYQVVALNLEDDVKGFINKLNEDPKIKMPGNEIVLNLDGCVTDYDATALLVDYLLGVLEHQQGEKTLTVKINGSSLINIIYYKLFRGGKYFDVEGKINSDSDRSQWDNVISNKLKEKSITLCVQHDRLRAPLKFPKL